jgi:SpoIID/LytB domain protein
MPITRMDPPSGVPTQRPMLIRRALLLTLLLALVAMPAAANAATRVVVRGAGFGHGVGLSQYGAYGYAQHGFDYREILSHYYTGTELGRASSRTVRVLLQQRDPYVRIRGAKRIGGKTTNPKKMYVARTSGSTVVVRNTRGKLLGRFSGGARATGLGSVQRLMGPAINGVSSGLYRGAIDMLPDGGGVTAVNAIQLEDYVRGVVPGEMPSSWSTDALKSQAVVARTYALATLKSGAAYDLYPDVRSQVYRGVVAEQASTNAATRSTAGQVVQYNGQTAITYYFSTSGGETENVENAFLGSIPKGWLAGVKDPFDSLSPKHRWTFRFTKSSFKRHLGGYVKGRYKKIKVLTRGVSPRVIRARVYGTRGTTTVSGPTLRARLGTYDSWLYFTNVSSSPAAAIHLARSRTTLRPHTIVGSFAPAPRSRRVAIERRDGRRWRRVAVARTSRAGAYRAALGRAGVYRVRHGAVIGPSVRIR